jgi:hypothetical protein
VCVCVCVCVCLSVVFHPNGAELESLTTPAKGEVLRAVLFHHLQHHQHYMHLPQQLWHCKLNYMPWIYKRSELCVPM